MVNTFVISTDLTQCARQLDYRRLGKQRVEAMQIIKALEGGNPGWSKHPATLMWKDHVSHLKVYCNHMIREWIRRGYNNTMQLYDLDESLYHVVPCDFDGITARFLSPFTAHSFPSWFSFPPFIYAHRAALVRKDPVFYASLLDEEVAKYMYRGYLWPHSLPPNAMEAWDASYLHPVGTGAPAQYRISKEEVLQWMEQPQVNPRTGRAISSTSAIYKGYLQAKEAYEL